MLVSSRVRLEDSSTVVIEHVRWGSVSHLLRPVPREEPAAYISGASWYGAKLLAMVPIA